MSVGGKPDCRRATDRLWKPVLRRTPSATSPSRRALYDIIIWSDRNNRPASMRGEDDETFNIVHMLINI